MRVGLDFTKPLKSRRPSQSFIDQMRAQFGGAAGVASREMCLKVDRPKAAPPPDGGPREGGFRGGGRGFGGGGFGGSNRGRIQFSLTDTITSSTG